MALLIVSTLLKIAFVLALLLGISPVLTWLERRQSAMMQDRVGPVRAGVPLSEGIARFVKGPLGLGAKTIAYLCAGLSAIALANLGYLFMVRDDLRAAIADQGSREALVEAWRGVIGWWVPGASADALGARLDQVASQTPGLLRATVDDTFSQVLQGYGWAVVVLAVLALVHFAASWIIPRLIDKRGHLTAFGLIHVVADVTKTLWKEDFVPPRGDKLLHAAAPLIATFPAFATFAVIPFGPALHWGPEGNGFAWLFSVVPRGAAEFGRTIPLQVANLNVGILYIFAIAGTGVIGAAIAGYSSDNKYSLLGGVRAASQMVSYEVTLGLTLVGCFMVYGTLLLDEMVVWQQQHLWGFLVQPLALILFFFCSMAEMKRVPFDAPEGESEIVAGYFLEYSGMKWVLFMTGEFVEHIVAAGIIATLFFGGYDVPFLEVDGFHIESLGLFAPLPHVAVVVISALAFVLKVFIINILQLQVRWTLPRFRYDQIMQLCWKIILPLSLANILITGIVILMLQ